MELEFSSKSKIPIEPKSKTLIGRNSALQFAADRTISRNHLKLHLQNDHTDKFVIKFEVIGKNPIWIWKKVDGESRIYRNNEKGELRSGDELSLSLKKPFLCVVKKKEGDIKEDNEVELGIEEIGCLDVSQIDAVKEFGFLLKGHEFDQYCKKLLPDIKKWNWFLEESIGNSDDDDDDETTNEATNSKREKNKSRKKRKSGVGADDEWTGESEEEKVVVGGSSKRTKYSTRSEDSKRSRNDSSVVRNASSKKDNKVDEDESEEEDEDDETLGGFIVDEDVDEEEGDTESEEEFEDEEEEDED